MQVHDRSRSKPEQLEVAHIFGEDPLDVQKIITPGMSLHHSCRTCRLFQGISTKNNPFKSKWEPWDPYGVCQFNLSDLGSGTLTMKMSAMF